MSWELYTPHVKDSNLGKVVSVYLNENKSLIKRYFIPGGITSHGTVTEKTPEYIEQKWNQEISALKRFEGFSWVPGLVEINEKEKYIIQEYYGPCLLYQPFNDIPDLHQQIVDIYTYFKKINVYKLNGSLANSTRKDNRLIFFDFKYMVNRSPDLKPYAEYEIDAWLYKFGKELVPKLKDLL